MCSSRRSLVSLAVFVFDSALDTKKCKSDVNEFVSEKHEQLYSHLELTRYIQKIGEFFINSC